MADGAFQALTEGQLRVIRRREYYNRRVKTDFAPKNEIDELDEELNDGMSPMSPFEK